MSFVDSLWWKRMFLFVSSLSKGEFHAMKYRMLMHVTESSFKHFDLSFRMEPILTKLHQEQKKENILHVINIVLARPTVNPTEKMKKIESHFERTNIIFLH